MYIENSGGKNKSVVFIILFSVYIYKMSIKKLLKVTCIFMVSKRDDCFLNLE